jgi:L-amino acid N-acyltransferase YncA
MAIVLRDITFQNEDNIKRQNFWTEKGLWTPVGFMTEERAQYFELVDELKNSEKYLGVIGFFVNDDSQRVFSSVYVLPEHRKKGHAKTLYKKTLSKYKTSGVWAYIDEKNTPSINLHKTIGFSVKSSSINKKTHMFYKETK